MKNLILSACLGLSMLCLVSCSKDEMTPVFNAVQINNVEIVENDTISITKGDIFLFGVTAMDDVEIDRVQLTGIDPNGPNSQYFSESSEGTHISHEMNLGSVFGVWQVEDTIAMELEAFDKKGNSTIFNFTVLIAG